MLPARVGESKMSLCYEQEIRGLGEYAALPLLRYVQFPLSKPNAAQRRAAMRILADIAPTWAIGDLIAILPDEDGEIRVDAARALERLTGLTMGRPSDDWRKPWDECEKSHRRWESWWEGNRSRFPAPFRQASAPPLRKAGRPVRSHTA